MSRHLYIETLENNHVHFDMDHNEYTLCGLDTMGDYTLGIKEPIVTTKKVDCPTCIALVIFCKKIKSSEYKTQ